MAVQASSPNNLKAWGALNGSQGGTCGDRAPGIGDGVEDATCMRMVVDIGRRAECTGETARLEAEKSVDFVKGDLKDARKGDTVLGLRHARSGGSASFYPARNWLAAGISLALGC
jgi:hypothetical protein